MTPEEKKKILEDAVEVEMEGIRLALPKSPLLCVMGFKSIESKEGSLPAIDAAVAAAEWRRLCSKPKDCQCQCTCTFCVLAHAWQKYFERLMTKIEQAEKGCKNEPEMS